jgi:Icc-related predicted phosphoesterase
MARRERQTVRLAAVGDIHCAKTSRGVLRPLFEQVDTIADVLVLCGDLTDYGLPDEAHILVSELQATKVPVVAVLGNHDFESGQQDEVKRILCEAGVHLLDGDGVELRGVGFAGTKGFGGGFGQQALQPWGEETIKQYVREAVDETLKLESALARLRTSTRIVVLHYSPIQATVEGEPPAIFPFLGSSRLEEPVNRYSVEAVFHGHAHHGCAEGKTSANVPVFNVALPLLRRRMPSQPPFRLYDVELEPAGRALTASAASNGTG